MSGALPHRGALDMGRGHDAIACDAGGGDLRPAWSRQKQVSRNDELRYHNDFQRGRVIAQERSVRYVTVIRTGAISQHQG